MSEYFNERQINKIFDIINKRNSEIEVVESTNIVNSQNNFKGPIFSLVEESNSYIQFTHFSRIELEILCHGKYIH